MKKATILVIILSMLVIGGAAALRTNSIIQSPSEPSRLISFEDFEAPGIVIESSDIFTDFIAIPAPLTPKFVNCTVNFTVIFPMTANVYTDKEVYSLGEVVTYGIENTLNYDIGGVSVSIQKDVNRNWMPIVLTHYVPLLLEPDQTYESTWDQKFNGRQVETGMYRVAIGYGYYDGVSRHGMGYAYFSITNTYPVVIPPDYPLSQNGLNYICENFGDINLCCVRTGLSWYFTLEGTDYPETGGTAQIVARLASGLIDSLTMTSPARGTFTQVDLNTANGGPVTLEDARLVAEHDDTSADQWCYGG